MEFGTEKEMREILAGKKRFRKNNCPFCHDITHDERIIWKNKDWVILWNKYPYVLENRHIMLIPIRHVVMCHEISSDEWLSIDQAHAFLRDFYGGDEYFSFTRESFANRSVEHVHTHFMHGELKRATLEEMLEKQGFEVNSK